MFRSEKPDVSFEKSAGTLELVPKEGKSTSTKSNTSVKTRYSLSKGKKALNLRYKGTQNQVDTNIKRHIQQVARKTVRLSTKVKDPKTFEQKYKTIDGKILMYIPHIAWVQTKGKQPRLLRNSGFPFAPNPKTYSPCGPS